MARPVLGGSAMIDGIYNGAASLSGLERWQAVISQNLAASSAVGFKKSELSFEGVETGKSVRAQDGGLSTRSTEVTVPKTGTVINFANGDLRETGKDTDFAVEGPGFFQVRRPGGNGIGYTRDGEFHINADSVLVTKHGYEVLGEDGPIVIDPDEGRVSLGEDGTLSQGDNVIGKLSLRDFPDAGALNRLDGGLFGVANGVIAGVVEQPSISQGAIESSNVSPLAEMVNLVSVSRAYEASQKMITSHDEMLRQAIQTLGTPQA